MSKTALITGASGGIGKELARIHASQGGNLVLVARNLPGLQTIKAELESQFPVKIYLIGKDLSVPGAALQVYEETKKQNICVDILINNAGYGDFGWFTETSLQKEVNMINLNIKALIELTKFYSKEMAGRKAGHILNVASTAAFQPGPTMAVYFATKAYVLHFSEALSYELRSQGVSVTALCPGPTQSGFQSAAGMDDSNLFKGRKIPTAKEVAEFGYRAMMKGRPVAVHGTLNRIMAFSVRLSPRKMVLWLTQKIMQVNNQ